MSVPQPIAPPPSLTGVVPPLVTPLTSSYDVDTVSLARLVHHQLSAGVRGLFVLGTSGEGTFLTDDQRRQVLETTVSEVSGSVPVLAGVIDTSTNRVGEHLAAAMKARVDGVVTTAPFYAATHPAEMERHFTRLAELADGLPVFAYDIPSRIGGTKLPADLLIKLGADDVLAGVKDSSGLDSSLRALVLARETAALQNFVIMTGSELTVDSALSFGVDGVVPGLGNVDPAGYVRIFNAITAGDTALAGAEQARLFRLFDIVKVGDRRRMGQSAASLGAFKAALFLLGVISSPVTAYPSVPLDDSEVAGVRELLEQAGLI